MTKWQKVKIILKVISSALTLILFIRRIRRK
jgi:hypothetical protein